MENMRRKLLMDLIEKMRERERGEDEKHGGSMVEEELDEPKMMHHDDEEHEDDHEVGEHDPEEEEEMASHLGESPEEESIEDMIRKDFKYHPRSRPGVEIMMGVGATPKEMSREMPMRGKRGRPKGYKMKKKA